MFGHIDIGTILATLAIGGIVTLIGFLMNRTFVKGMDDLSAAAATAAAAAKESNEGLLQAIEKVKGEISAFKFEIMRDFVRRCDFDKNDEAHKELWRELNGFRERLAGAETKIEIKDDLQAIISNNGGKQ